MRIFNKSTSAVARSCAVAPGNVVVWLELAPQHSAVLKAIWATLVNNTKDTLGLRDGEATIYVAGLHSRYVRLAADAPMLAGRTKPKFLRLVAPQGCRGANTRADFYVFAWPGLSPGTALAAMLEANSSLPMRIGWGERLLYEAMRLRCAAPLVAFGSAPDGYRVSGDTRWVEIIREGVSRGHLTLDGGATPVSADAFEEVKAAALARAGADVAREAGDDEDVDAEKELVYADH